MNQNKDTLRENSLALIANWRDELGSEVDWSESTQNNYAHDISQFEGFLSEQGYDPKVYMHIDTCSR